MADATDRAWEEWAKLDPYYAVVTHPQFRKSKIKENLDEFFTSGQQDVSKFLDIIETRFGPVDRSRALDFGSGVGRLSVALGRQFNQVVGVDVSEKMIEIAESHLRDMNIKNISYTKSDDVLSRVSGNFSYVNSYIVLQHISRQRGMKLIDLLLKKSDEGGAAMIHVSLRREKGLLSAATYWLKFNLPLFNEFINLIKRRPVSEPPMRMTEYDLCDVLKVFRKNHFRDYLIELETHEGPVTTARICSKRSRDHAS